MAEMTDRQRAVLLHTPPPTWAGNRLSSADRRVADGLVTQGLCQRRPDDFTGRNIYNRTQAGERVLLGLQAEAAQV